MEAIDKYKKWLAQPGLDPGLRKELEEMDGDESRIRDCFYQELTFGTAGDTGAGPGAAQA